ncbi:MAG: hypothetical protein AB8G86_29550 [Saprospiraceae bacterium]
MQQFFSLAFFLLLFNQFSITAQTVSYSEEVGTLEQQQLVDAKNCFFKNQESVSRIWKLNVIDLLNTEVNFSELIIELETGLGIGYEQRLKTGWSLNFSLDGSLFTARSNDKKFNLPTYSSDIGHIVKQIGFSIEPR